MKKAFILLLIVSILTLSAAPALAVNFDITPFESSDLFEVEFDEMDDTGTISLAGDGGLGSIVGIPSGDSGLILGKYDIRLTDDNPPVFRITFLYYGDDWIFTDDVIIKTADSRYTFEVDRDTEIDGGKIYEMYTLVITDQNHKMIEEILKGDGTFKCRFSGDRDVDFDAGVGLEKLQAFYDAYLSSGALNNDFTKINLMFPCTIK